MIKHAFISAEDKNFYEPPRHRPRRHFLRARSVCMVLGQAARAQGASTITQQVAKNFLL